MTDTLTEVRASLQEAADASEVPAYQRLQRLRAIRAELVEALEAADEFMREADVVREGEQFEVELGILALRSRATISEQLLIAGRTTDEELAEAGVLSHDDIDALEEEGLLEAAAREMIDAGKLEIVDEDSLGNAVLAGVAPEDAPEDE